MKYATNDMIGTYALISQSDHVSKGSKIYEPFIDALQRLNEIISSNVGKIIADVEEENLCLVQDTKESFESFKKILRKDSFYEDEYYAFYSIKVMAFYLLDDKSLHHYLDMVLDLIAKLIELIQSKKGDLNEYSIKKEEFSLFFCEYEEKFYTSICKPSKHYDEETLSKIMTGLLNL